MQLPKAFVQDDADRVREVQTADFAAGHGDAEGTARVPREDFRRQAARFRAEEQAIAGLKRNPRIGLCRMGAQAEDSFRVCER